MKFKKHLDHKEMDAALDLLAYRSQDLPSRVTEHLKECRACARIVEDGRAYRESSVSMQKAEIVDPFTGLLTSKLHPWPKKKDR